MIQALDDLQDEPLYLPAWVRDLASFREWTLSDDFPEHGRISYLGGEIVFDMAAQRIGSHDKVKGELYRGLGNFLRERNSGDVLTDPTRYVNQAAQVSHEPDAIVCLAESLRAGRITYRESAEDEGGDIEVTGSPDVIVEVVSRSSVRKDTVILPERYFLAGVREYWLIDARGDVVEFTLHTRGSTAFEVVEPTADGFRRSDVLDAEFLLSRSETDWKTLRYQLDWR